MSKRVLAKITIAMLMISGLGVMTPVSASAQVESSNENSGLDFKPVEQTDLQDTVTYVPNIRNDEKLKGENIINQMMGNNKAYALDGSGYYASRELEDKIIEYTNKLRTSNGVEPLENSDVLRFSARYKDMSMARFNYFAHENPNMDNGNPGALLRNLGIYNWNHMGENILKCGKFRDTRKISAFELYQSWEGSDGHRKNMMNPDFKYIGVGVIVSEDGTIYGTQHFFTNRNNEEPRNNQLEEYKDDYLKVPADFVPTNPGEPEEVPTTPIEKPTPSQPTEGSGESVSVTVTIPDNGTSTPGTSVIPDETTITPNNPIQPATETAQNGKSEGSGDAAGIIGLVFTLGASLQAIRKFKK